MAVTWSSLSWPKSLYAAPTAKKGSGIDGQTTRSATAPTERTAERDADRDCHDDLGRVFGPKRGYRSHHRGARGQAVVDDDHHGVGHRQRLAAEGCPAALQLGLLAGPDSFERRV